MKKLTYWLRNYFAFSQIEIRSFITMTVMMIILLLLTFVNKFTNVTNGYTATDTAADQQIMKNWLTQINEHEQQFQAQKQAEREEKAEQRNYYQNNYQTNTDYKANNNSVAVALFSFNPNEADEQTFIKLGLPKFIAQRIINYRNKGGQFRIKEDFKKMYGLTPEKYAELAPYLALPDKLEKQTFLSGSPSPNNTAETKPAYKPKTIVAFDLNQADTATLKTIRGIGAVLSDRIVKFRNNLGGFHSLDQVQEVYGIQPEVLEELAKYATINPDNIKKINVNTADETSLKNHPYIGYKLANVLVAYRKQHGNFATADDLLKIKILTAEKLQKLKPYLVF